MVSCQFRLEHRDDNPDQHEDSSRQAGDGPGDELLHHAHITDQPAHQPTDAVVIVEVQRQRVQVAKELAAHIGHHLGADKGHQIDARAVGHPFDQRRGHEDQAPSAQALQVTRSDALVDGAADDPRPRDRHQRRDNHQRHRGNDPVQVGQVEVHQPSGEPAVVHLAQHIVVLLVGQQILHQRLAPLAAPAHHP